MQAINLNLRVWRLPAASAPTGGQLSAAEIDANFTNLRTAAEQLDEEKADVAHDHAIASVTGLQSALDSKAATAHDHAIANVTGLQAALDSKAATAHDHAIANVTGLQAALDSKAATAHDHAIANVTGLQAALDSKAATAHDHAIANVTGLQAALDSKAPVTRVTATASSATPSINTDTTDVYRITALAANITAVTVTGTPAAGQVLLVEITGTATRLIAWGASFEASTVALPTTTVGTEMLLVAFLWNPATSRWRCVGVA